MSPEGPGTSAGRGRGQSVASEGGARRGHCVHQGRVSCSRAAWDGAQVHVSPAHGRHGMGPGFSCRESVSDVFNRVEFDPPFSAASPDFVARKTFFEI